MAKAISNYRRTRAVELALSGHSYDDIAREVGYSNRGTAWRAVQNALNRREVAAVDEYRRVELARLDALQRALWDRALEGDRSAVDGVLGVIERRIRLLGLDRRALRGDRHYLVGQ